MNDYATKSPDCIHPSSFVRAAVSMGIDPVEALRARYRYLRTRFDDFKQLYSYHKQIDPYFWWMTEAATELRELVAYARRYKLQPTATRTGITDNMIQAAKSYPIGQLLELSHGRTFCFSHNSKAHDLSFHAKSNTVRCFGACGRSFNTIDILMIRDGMTFPAAVRYLQ